MTRCWVLGCLLLFACATEAPRSAPTDCAKRRATADKAAAEVERLTKEARESLGEEAATLAWWKVREAEEALDTAQDALRDCPK